MEYAKRKVIEHNHWDKKYGDEVVAEFERFIVLRNKYEDEISPPDDIDILWHQILLDTRFYYLYCVERFGKIVHHDPSKSEDQESRQVRLRKTIEVYQIEFRSPAPPKIYGGECILCIRIVNNSYFRQTVCCKNNSTCIECLKKVSKCPFCNHIPNKGMRLYTLPPTLYDPEEIVNIYIVSLTGKRTIVNEKLSCTILRLKELYEMKNGDPPDQQNFIYLGRQLENDKTLIDYQIHRESTIHMILKLRGC